MKKLYLFVFLIAILALFVGCEGDGVEDTACVVSAEYFSDENTVSATMAVDYFNSADTELNLIKFYLPASAYREGASNKPCPAQSEDKAFYAGKSYGGIDVKNCLLGDEVAEWEIAGKDENVLIVRLKEGLFPAERVGITIEFEVSLPLANLRLGKTERCVNVGDWLPLLCAHSVSGFYECIYSPVGDPYCAEAVDYTVSLTVDGQFSVAAGGECTRTEVGEDKTTYTYLFENARDVAFVLSTGYEVVCSEAAGIPVSLYHLGREGAEDALKAAVSAVEVFSELFGEYPYPSLAVAETDFLQGGMEYPSFAYVSASLDKEDFITAIVHEVAHQWWGCGVGNNQIEHAFLDEGLAEYSTLLFYEKKGEYGRSREGIVRAKTDEYRAFYGVYEQLKGEVNTAMQRSLFDFDSEYEYVEICYVKPVIMFDGFRRSVGDARFFKGLRRFYSQGLFRIVTPAHLISAFEGVGCDSEGYFNSFIEGKAII